MSEALRARLIPLTAAAIGAVVATVVGTQLRDSGLEDNRSVASRFDQQPPAVQQRLVNNARSFHDIDEGERRRLQTLHREVENDPELKAKLEAFHKKWLALDPADRRLLRNPDGSFADNWNSEVESVFASCHAGSNRIAVRIPTPGYYQGREPPLIWDFTEQSFQAFLDDVIPTPPPTELQKRLDKFEHGIERRLSRTVWLVNQTELPWAPPGGPRKEVSLEQVRTAAFEHLVPSEFTQKFREYADENPGFDANRVEVSIALRCVDAAVDYFKDRFRMKYLDEKSDLLAVYESLDSDAQLDLMKQDARDARRSLQDTLMKRRHQENPDFEELRRDLDRASRELFGLRRTFIRNGWRGPGSRGGRGGSRSGFGGPRREDDGRRDERGSNGNGSPNPGFDSRPPRPPGEGHRPHRNGGTPHRDDRPRERSVPQDSPAAE